MTGAEVLAGWRTQWEPVLGVNPLAHLPNEVRWDLEDRIQNALLTVRDPIKPKRAWGVRKSCYRCGRDILHRGGTPLPHRRKRGAKAEWCVAPR